MQVEVEYNRAVDLRSTLLLHDVSCSELIGKKREDIGLVKEAEKMNVRNQTNQAQLTLLATKAAAKAPTTRPTKRKGYKILLFQLDLVELEPLFDNQ